MQDKKPREHRKKRTTECLRHPNTFFELRRAVLASRMFCPSLGLAVALPRCTDKGKGISRPLDNASRTVFFSRNGPIRASIPSSACCTNACACFHGNTGWASIGAHSFRTSSNADHRSIPTPRSREPQHTAAQAVPEDKGISHFCTPPPEI